MQLEPETSSGKNSPSLKVRKRQPSDVGHDLHSKRLGDTLDACHLDRMLDAIGELIVASLRWDNGIVVLQGMSVSLTEAGGKTGAEVSQCLRPALRCPAALGGQRERKNMQGHLSVVLGPRRGRSRGSLCHSPILFLHYENFHN